MKLYDKLISLYAKLTNRYIVTANKKYTTQYFQNGSVVKNPRLKSNENIRGQRADIDFFYDDFYTQKQLDEILKPYIKGEDYDT